MDPLDINLNEAVVPSGSQDYGRQIRPHTGTRKTNLTTTSHKHDRQQRTSNNIRRNKHSFSNETRTYLQGRSSYNQSHHNNNNSYHHHHRLSKQQFLQANCQFVVLNGHDYTIHKVDPDWPVDWDCVEEVRFKQCASTETTCPICLERPIAAKITRCGHIYCWACILHYLSLTDENCRQCPICFEPVYKNDLRSVTSHSYVNHAVDEEIELILMIRNKGCVDVEPYVNESTRASNPTFSSSSSSSSYDMITRDHYSSQANLVIVDPLTAVTQIAERERNELSTKLEFDRNDPGVCFLEQALALLSQRVDKLNKMISSGTTGSTKRQAAATAAHQIQSASPDPSKTYLFYQSSDGQYIYLNPFSTKILCHEYGSLENCPTRISAKILQMDWISMNEAWRKRFKYLGHLPLTCEFRLIEIDLDNTGIISRETYQLFADQILKRKQERDRRQREEKKRERIIQVQQNKKIYGIQSTLKINLNNIDQFPSVSDERYLGLTLPTRRSKFCDEDLEDYDISSNEDEPAISQPPIESELGPEPTTSNSNDANATPDDTERDLAGMTLSFKEIQLQEAELAAKERTKNPSGTRPWGGSASQGRSGPNQQSSFAQLVVNAKMSKKEWTKNPNSTSIGSNFPSLRPQAGGSGASRVRAESNSDGGDEELRVPSSEFTISDFIDMNVLSSSSSGKKKGKIRGARKKN